MAHTGNLGMLIRHGSHFTVDTIFVVLVVFVLIVMCASRLSVCYAQFTVEQEQGHGANRIGKVGRATISHVPSKFRKSTGLKLVVTRLLLC